MTRNGNVLSVALFSVGLVAAACGGSPGSSTTVTETVPASTTSTTVAATTTTATPSAPATTASADLQSLIATPANSQRTDGPEPIQESGIHLHFLVNGAPLEVMDAYKTALEGKGWSLTVERSGGGGGGGGATYTGTNGGSYGVFVGGGYGGTTDVNSCAWPSKPSKTNCGRDN
jgi:galactitol-specific phosphotransferase system IIB component